MRSLRMGSGSGGERRSRVCAATVTSSVDGLCGTGYMEGEKRKEGSALLVIEEHAIIEEFRIGV